MRFIKSILLADDVDKETSGKLKLALHPSASLFKLSEIKRAVQTADLAQALATGITADPSITRGFRALRAILAFTISQVGVRHECC